MRKTIELIQSLKLQLKWKLLGGFLLANSALFTALGLALFALFSNQATMANLKSSNEHFQALGQIETAQAQMVTTALDYGWSSNLHRLNDYEIAKQNLERVVTSFNPDPLQAENYEALKTEVNALRKALDQIITLADNTQEIEAQASWRGLGSKQAIRTRSIIQELNRQELYGAEASYKQTIQETSNLIWLITALALMALTIAIGLALLMTAALIGPVMQLKKRLADMAGGDLTQKVHIANHDELGDLGATYNSALDSLKDLVKQLYTQSQRVSISTEKLNSQACNQIAGTAQQASAIAEATCSIKELNRTAEEIARQAMKVTEAVEHTLKRARSVNRVADEMATAQEQGRATVARTINAIFNLREQVSGIQKNQQELVVQSTAIQSIIDLIAGIARETHLLALNASIEAAGAGSQGTRFAVIAGEVKQLADRSLIATKRVKGALEGILLAVDRVSNSTLQSMREAEQAVEDVGNADAVLLALTALSQQVKEAAQEIVGYIEGSASLATNIVIATQQQQIASQQMLETMVSIEAVTAQHLSSIHQGEVVTYQLSASARELEQSADAFKVAA